MCSNQLKPYLRGVTDSVTGLQFDVLKCAVCGMGVTDPAPNQLQAHYAEYYGTRHGITARFCDRRRIALVTRMAGPGRGKRLLDIGCGEGTFLHAARKCGWDAIGTELNSAPAQRLGLEVFNSLDECADRGPFDCVTLWHSLEHTPDPWAVIANIRRSGSEGWVDIDRRPRFWGTAVRDLWIALAAFGSSAPPLSLYRYIH